MSRYTVALEDIGGLSNPSKMPCQSWSIPPELCVTGSKLREIDGTVCSSCYACKGCYLFRSTQEAMMRRYAILLCALTDTEAGDFWVEDFTFVLNEKAKRGAHYWRWFDAGDLQSVEHLRLIVRVAEATPNVNHWLPTRETAIVRAYLRSYGALPHNIVIRLSALYIDGKEEQAILSLIEDYRRVTASGVHSVKGNPVIGTECQAYKNNGACGDCRLCWTLEKVSYPEH